VRMVIQWLTLCPYECVRGRGIKYKHNLLDKNLIWKHMIATSLDTVVQKNTSSEAISMVENIIVTVDDQDLVEFVYKRTHHCLIGKQFPGLKLHVVKV